MPSPPLQVGSELFTRLGAVLDGARGLLNDARAQRRPLGLAYRIEGAECCFDRVDVLAERFHRRRRVRDVAEVVPQ